MNVILKNKSLFKNRKSTQETHNERHSEEQKIYSKIDIQKNANAFWRAESLVEHRKSSRKMQNERHSEKQKACLQVESPFKISRMNVFLENRKYVKKKESLIRSTIQGNRKSVEQKKCFPKSISNDVFDDSEGNREKSVLIVIKIPTTRLDWCVGNCTMKSTSMKKFLMSVSSSSKSLNEQKESKESRKKGMTGKENADLRSQATGTDA